MKKADLPSIFGLSVDQEEASIADSSNDLHQRISSKFFSCKPHADTMNPYAASSSNHHPHVLQRSSSCTMATISPSSPHHNYEADDDDDQKQSLAMAAAADDGSVASRLLGAIGKSISSPSLSSCKEIALETPYQKSLKLRRMKLHHCTEELGSESCCPSISLSQLEYDQAYPPHSHEEEISPFLPSRQEGAAPSSPLNLALPRRLSAPNLCKLLTNKDATTPMAKRVFPPPIDSAPALVHPSPSADTSFSSTLLSIKQDGRFVLKEVKVPIPQTSLRASRIAGRLTLYIAHPMPQSTPTMGTGGAIDQGGTCKDNEEQMLVQLPSMKVEGHSQFKTSGEEVERTKEGVEKPPFPLRGGLGKHSMLETGVEEDGLMDDIEEGEEEEEEDLVSMPPNNMELTTSVKFNDSNKGHHEISCKGLSEIDNNFNVYTLSSNYDEVNGSSAFHNHEHQASSSNKEIKPYLSIRKSNNLEWLRPTHCKDRKNVLIGKSFTKVHCVATRS